VDAEETSTGEIQDKTLEGSRVWGLIMSHRTEEASYVRQKKHEGSLRRWPTLLGAYHPSFLGLDRYHHSR